MALIVQKFGGTSVADTQKILAAARKAIRETLNGNQVVMVVSAMGKNTDHLVDLAKEISEHPPAREMDMLLSTGEQVTVSLMAMALESLGHKAVSYTGAQIGILTDNTYTKARIRSISTDRMRKSLDEGKIVIVAGFQGIDDDFNITTLGRGGSDTTAVALAAALKADTCDIYTDVDGVYTTDPRILPEARKVDRISYDEMLELASLGAGVMHSRSIEFAKKFGVLVHVRNSLSFSDSAGTLIGSKPECLKTPVCGAVLAKDEALITLRGVPDVPGIAMNLFSKIAAAKIATDMIVQNVSTDGKTNISFTVVKDELDATLSVVRAVAEKVGALAVEFDENVSKVSVVGLGMETQHSVAERMFRALAKRDVNIRMITTSEIKISALVSKESGLTALRAVHEDFQLHLPPDQRDTPVAEGMNVQASSVPVPSSTDTDVEEHLQGVSVSRLAGMEDIIIEAVSLDRTQARFTLVGLEDTPGLAASVFEQIGRHHLIVDMIVQSASFAGKADISFTVQRKDCPILTGHLAPELEKQFGCRVLCNPTVAKLTVRGTGLRSHVGLAFRMFKTLSDAEINVSIIATSERSVNVIVDDSASVRGLNLLSEEFAADMM